VRVDGKVDMGVDVDGNGVPDSGSSRSSSSSSRYRIGNSAVPSRGVEQDDVDRMLGPNYWRP
jgi:glycine/serine hydroxymethyltransferase